MKVVLRIVTFFLFVSVYPQADYSSDWTDFFSYNKIVNFDKSGSLIYAVTENAAFTLDVNSNATQKFSSVNGLSGNNTSSSLYDLQTNKFIIGYENGLLEIVDEYGNVKKIVDISLSEVSTEKIINSITSHDTKIYLSTGFGIVVYDMVDLEFDDTYFIGVNSTNISINDVLIFEDTIYATTNEGVYIADFGSNLNDSSNWVKTFTGAFSNIILFQDNILVSRGSDVYSITDQTVLELKFSLSSAVVSFSSFEEKLMVTSSKQAFIYNDVFQLQLSTQSSDFTITSSSLNAESIFLGTNELGVLSSDILDPDMFEENHPDGPFSKDLFSITVHENDVWCVYGGIQPSYAPLGRTSGISHFDGVSWSEIPYGSPDGVASAKDLLHVTVDPVNSDKVYVSSWSGGGGSPNQTAAGGVLILQNDAYYDFWNSETSGLTHATYGSYITTRIYGTDFDSKGNLWIGNSFIKDGFGELKKYSSDGVWTEHSLTQTNFESDVLVADNGGNIWMGSRGKGVLVYNEEGDRASELVETNGLPSSKVTAIAVDSNSNVWIGTAQGVVLFSDVENVFSGSFNNAEPIIIDASDGASRLLDGLSITDIKIDAVGNVWFATASGGVLLTDSSGKNTLLGFNKDNSPLPSNNVLSIGIDSVSGKVYFGTDKGIVAYSSDVVPYGDVLKDVYAYPNPALKNHNEITITGKDSSIPLGTNMKILDVAGNLVFESNAIVSQSNVGGKFVWDKRNLAGAKVASGVYIILMYDSEGNQSSSTKIAIIN